MCSTGPDQQAAFNTPYFLHRIIPDFRRLGDTGDHGKFLKQQQKNLRKHDEREAAKNRKPAGPTTDVNMSQAIHVVEAEPALPQPSPHSDALVRAPNAESATIQLPRPSQQGNREHSTEKLPSQPPNRQGTGA